MENKPKVFDHYELSQELTKKGWRNLSILILVTLVATAWISWKFLVWQNNRELEAAQIAWNEQEIERAIDFLASVDRQKSNQARYDDLQLKLLLLTQPEQALDYLGKLRSEETIEETHRVALARLGLAAAIASEKPALVSQEIQWVTDQGLLSEGDPDLAIAQAWQSLYQNDADTLLAQIRNALRHHPLHEEALLLRSKIQSQSSDPIERIQALTTLRQIGKSTAPSSISANLSLLNPQLNDPKSIDSLEAGKRLINSPYFNFHYTLENPNILRSLIANSGQSDTSFGYALSKRLIQLQDANDSDRLKHCYFAQEKGDIENAREMLNRITLTPELAAQHSWITARQLAFEGRTEEATLAGIEGLDTDAKGQFAAFLLGLLESLDEEQNRTGFQSILKTPELPLSYYLRAAAALWDSPRESQENLIAFCIEKATTDPLPIALFFSQRQRPDLVTQCLATAPDTLASQMGFSLYLDALLRLEQWTEARRVIDSSTILTSYDQAVAELLYAFAQNAPETINEAWAAARTLCAQRDTSVQAIAKIANIAFLNNRGDWAEQTFQIVRERGELATLTVESLVRYAQLERRNGNTRHCLHLLQLALVQAPDRAALKREASYLQLLLGEDTLAAKDTLRKLLTEQEEDSEAELYLALALVKTGRSKQALERLLSNAAPKPPFSPSSQVIRYVVFSANGKDAEAQTAFDRIKNERLLPEESLLMSQHLNGQIESIQRTDLVDELRLIDRAATKDTERSPAP